MQEGFAAEGDVSPGGAVGDGGIAKQSVADEVEEARRHVLVECVGRCLGGSAWG